jgi:long-chain acyl-CoA synthetase
MSILQPVLLAHLADQFPDGVAWKNLIDGRALTLSEWHTQSNQLARGLRHRGLKPGDTVALALAPEDPLEWLVSYMAIHKAGCVALPLNTRLGPVEMQRIFDDAGMAALLVSASVRTRLNAVTVDAPVVTLGAADLESPSWHDLLDPDSSDLGHLIDSNDVADVMYTSGTTGEPNGVLVRHDGLSSSDRVPTSWHGLGFLSSSPFSTTSGSLLICGPLRGGLSGWFLPRFDPGTWLQLVATHRPVAGFLVPAMVQLLIAHPSFLQTDLSSLAVLNIGSAPISVATLRRFGQGLPTTDVMCGYGMTEFGAVTAMPPGDRGAHLGSVGLPLPGVALRVEGPSGMSLEAEQVGEILVRGSQSPRAQRQGRDAGRGPEGWLHTGDLGSLDADGYLWIAGRQKEMIIRGGHNVMPGEVESVLFGHPDVADATVAGIPHEVLGEDVAAWVVLRPGASKSADRLRTFLLEHLADYKAPRRITFVNALPRNEAGKVVKSQLPTPDEQGSTE